MKTHSRLHVEFSNGKLDLFVPSDATQRRICYSTQLPEALVDFLSINDPAARGTFAMSLREPIDALDYILREYGIIELPNLESMSSLVTEIGASEDEDTDEELSSLQESFRDDSPSPVREKTECQLSLRPKGSSRSGRGLELGSGRYY